MLATRLRRPLAAVFVALAPLAACSSAVSTPPSPANGGPTTLLVRLGADTVAMEQYTRTPTRMEGVLVQRAPFTTIARYSVDLGANSAPTRAEYSLRRGDGTPITGAMQSLSVRYGRDSVVVVGHRTGGDTTRATALRGELLPYLNGSYGLFELAFAKLRASGRDSAEFAIVPLNFAVRNTSALPVKLIGTDRARISWFGFPLYMRLDGRGSIVDIDGAQTTVKVHGERVAFTDLDTVARAWTARDQATGVAGPVSTRDTARATIGNAHVMVDYGRPALRGRDVWVNGVLGDTIWRTGANAATQLRTDADVVIGGATVPAGTYSLWTWATPRGYQLIVNKQAGQWGTEYHPDRDLARIPLREGTTAPPVERFTVLLEPQGGQGGAELALMWGTKRLTVPVAAK
jgi:hypothetical protein